MNVLDILPTQSQWIEGIVILICFPILAMIFRRFKLPYWLDNKSSFNHIPTRYIFNLFKYGIPAFCIWIVRKVFMNYYHKLNV